MRIQSRSLTAHRRYLSLLGTSSIGDLEESIVTRVLRQIRQGGQLALAPVRLSQVVDDFDIEPVPRFDSSIKHGRLDYDQSQNRFVISLPPRKELHYRLRSADLFTRRQSCTEDLELTRRLRFTYAHEVAHRFCFFRKDEQWIRAVSAAVIRKTASAVTRRLELNEEQLCNRVAGRLLVPEDILTEHIQQRLLLEAGTSFLDFHKELRSTANMFQVSEDCVFLQLLKASERGKIILPPNFCAFSLRFSDRTGASQRVERTFRIQLALLPKDIDGSGLRRIFPGMPGKNLGHVFSSWLSDLRKFGAKKESGPLEIPIVLRKVGEFSNEEFFFSGWWKFIGSQEPHTPQPMLLWGFIRP
jgi:hypothetical protein